MTKRSSQSGLTLAEVLVSITILALTMMLALRVYDQSRKSFKAGENAADQQQVVRIAFDTVSTDLRMAGFNYNPDGEPLRPDEQIEAAFDCGIVIRADFDSEDPVASADPEVDLAGLAFASVSTGNDEIVAYVLGKPDESPDEIVFRVDVSKPRDGLVEDVRIPRAVLDPDDPPYTLYKVTFDENGEAVPVPVADNIRSMNFRYFDRTGARIPAPGGADDEASIAARDSIRRIGIELEGLTRDPDLFYEDQEDPNPETRGHRKYMLAGDVALRNVGMIGVADINSDLTPPGAPAWPGADPPLVVGHCEGLYVNWEANPPADRVEYYQVMYGTDSNTTNNAPPTVNDYQYIDQLTDDTQYYVRLMAVDANDNASPVSSIISATTLEATRPIAPQNVSADADVGGWIDLAWDPVTENNANLNGDLESPMIRDLAGYRIYRRTDLGQPFGENDLIADQSDVLAGPHPTYRDSNVISCQEYHYLIEATDDCGGTGPAEDPVSATYQSGFSPETPALVSVLENSVDSIVELDWQAVTRNTDGTPITIDEYKVYRSDFLPQGSVPVLYPHEVVVAVDPFEAPSYVDSLSIPAGQTVFYKVSAVDHCPLESELSIAAEANCFEGNAYIKRPLDGAPAEGRTPISIHVDGGVEPFVGLTLEFLNLDTGVTDPVLFCPGAVGGECQFNDTIWHYDFWWNEPWQNYEIRATVTDANNCHDVSIVRVGPDQGS